MIYIYSVYVLNLKKEGMFYFSNYEDFDECMYGTCGGSVTPTRLRTADLDSVFLLLCPENHKKLFLSMTIMSLG